VLGDITNPRKKGEGEAASAFFKRGEALGVSEGKGEGGESLEERGGGGGDGEFEETGKNHNLDDGRRKGVLRAICRQKRKGLHDSREDDTSRGKKKKGGRPIAAE